MLLPAPFAVRTRGGVGLPVNGKGALVIARALAGLPARLGCDRPDDVDAIVLGATHEGLRVRISTIDEMVLGEPGVTTRPDWSPAPTVVTTKPVGMVTFVAVLMELPGGAFTVMVPTGAPPKLMTMAA